MGVLFEGRAGLGLPNKREKLRAQGIKGLMISSSRGGCLWERKDVQLGRAWWSSEKGPAQ